LLYGPPGTGKTEFAQAVAHAAGLGTYRVKTADDDGDGLSRKGRLGAYQLLQRLLRGRSDCLVIFDEVEDAFGNGGQDVLRALFGGRPASSHGEKGWMNRVLEENPVPAVWITNDADSMDPAFLRRFLLPVAFTTPPRAVRRRMVGRHLGDTALPEAFLDELAADDLLAPAQFGAARRLLDLQPGSDPVEAVRGGLSATRRLLHGSGAPQRRQSATPFDPAFLNLAGGIAPGAWPRPSSATATAGCASTARRAPARPSSPMCWPTRWAGSWWSRPPPTWSRNTSARPSATWPRCSPASTRSARCSSSTRWTACCGTAARRATAGRPPRSTSSAADGALPGDLHRRHQPDGRARRRRAAPLRLQAALPPLAPAQRLALFAREALGSAEAVDAIPPLLVRKLHSLELLTPGDFANVVRQRTLLCEALAPEDFLRRLIAECRWKGGGAEFGGGLSARGDQARALVNSARGRAATWKIGCYRGRSGSACSKPCDGRQSSIKQPKFMPYNFL
jgi:hypothetical protein